MTATVDLDLVEGLSQHAAWLRTALHARLGNHDEVDEVMQEIALAAATQASKQQPPIHRVGPWLYRVALRQVMLFRRKAGRRRKLNQSLQRHYREAPQACPLQFLLSRERQLTVTQAMSRLSELDRQLLMLKYVENQSYGEIAGRLGVTASAVQSRLHRARAQLRNLLTTDESGSNDENL